MIPRAASRRAAASLLLLGIAAWVSPAAGQQEEAAFAIAVVADGPTPADTFTESVRQELGALLHSGTAAVFKQSPEFTGDWTAAGAARALQAALEDPEVDLILVPHGLVAAAAAAAALEKPVVLGFVLRADFFSLLDATATPRKPNVSFVVTPQSLVDEISGYRAMVPFDTAFVAVEEAYVRFLEQRARTTGNALSRRAEIDLELLAVGPDGSTDLDRVVAANGAILYLGGGRIDTALRRNLFQRAADRGIPVFSLEGHADVEAGALAANVPSTRRLVARRLALNIVDIMRGRPTTELPVLLPGNESLLINGETAAKVAYIPDIRTRAAARILHPEALDMNVEELSVRRAYGLADGANLTIRLRERDVAIAERDRDLGKSQFLPQIVFNPNYFVMDAQGLQGLIPDQALNLAGGLRQMIWDQRTVSDYKSARSLAEGSRQQLETRRLDVLARTGEAFHALARGQRLQEVLIANLRLTETNLQLAQLRREVGFSGRDEVLRWESEVAFRRSEVVRSLARISTRQVQLNQVMGTDQTREWRPTVPEINPDRFPFLDGRVSDISGDFRKFRRFRELMVQFAYENAPELRTLDKGIEAQQYQLTERQRRWYLPDVWLSFDYRYQAWRSPDIDASRSIPFLSINAQYPLFVGGARTQEVEKATEQISRLNQEQLLARQLIERRTRSSINKMEGTFPAIGLAVIATEAARANLALVQEKYIQGLVNVTDLLQAQNAAFVAEQNLADVVYEFLQDYVDFQRAIAWFEAYKSEEEKSNLADRIQEALR